MSLYQQLRQLQHISNAYENWSEYRHAVTSYLIASTDADSSLAIFGAGNCNDLDLSLLISHFSDITLIDRDSSAMKQALIRYQLSDYPKITLADCDLVGICDSDYEDFADTLLEQIKLFGTDIDSEFLTDIALSYLHQLYERTADHRVSFGRDHFDYSVTLGLHSQLNNMPAWIFQAVTSALSFTGSAVTDYIASRNAPIVKKVNDSILDCTKKAALFGNERRSTASDTPIAGAIECILDLKQRYPDCKTAVTEWPFDLSSNRSYEMLLQTITF